MKTRIGIFLLCVTAVLAGMSAGNYAPRPHVDMGTSLFDQRLPRQLVMIGDANKVVFYSKDEEGDWRWWSIRAPDTIILDANYIFPAEPNDVNSVLYIKSVDSNEITLDWGPFDANWIIQDSNGTFTFPTKTPWCVIFVDANGYPLSEDPNNFTYYEPNTAFGIGLDNIAEGTYANNYIQVYKLLNFDPNLFNTSVGWSYTDSLAGPNNVRLGYYAGRDLRDGYQNTLGGRDNGRYLTDNVDNSFWGFQAGKNIKTAAVRDEAYAFPRKDYMVWFDADLDPNYEGLSGTNAHSVDADDFGVVVVGHSNGVSRWDTDLTRDDTFFLPDGGWSGQPGTVRFTDDNLYLYVGTSSPGRIYKFDATTGDVVWSIVEGSGYDAMDVDSNGDFYLFTGSGSSPTWVGMEKRSKDDGSVIWTATAPTVGELIGNADCVLFDETNNRCYLGGIWNCDGPTPPTGWWHLFAFDSDGGNLNYAQQEATPNIIKVGEYLYKTGGTKVIKFDESLVEQASYTTGGSTHGICYDIDGNIAVIMQAFGSNESRIFLFDTDLNYIDEGAFSIDLTYNDPELVSVPYASSVGEKGSRNTSIGSQALAGASGGADPNEATAGGYKSMLTVESGNQSTGYGAYSLGQITTGSLDLALGPYAGWPITTEDDYFVIDSRKRDTIADMQDNAILVGKMADAAANQWLNINADVNMPSLALTDLTASRLVATDADKKLASVTDLTSWIGGTANQVTVTDDADGTVTLSTPQDIHTGATDFTVAGLTVVNKITEFSTDGTMAGNSDSAVPTEKAVKTYVDLPFAPLELAERSSDPPWPTEGQMYIWMSDGTGEGDDGDLMITAHVGGVTKLATLWDFSAASVWTQNVIYNGENVVYAGEQVVYGE